MVSSLKLVVDSSIVFVDPTLYFQVVGALHYLTFTCLDLTYHANKVSQFMHQPQFHHWKFVKWILRYVACTSSYGFGSLILLIFLFVLSSMSIGDPTQMIASQL